MKKILVLASNPNETSALDLSKEIRDIKEGLKRSQNRHQFRIEICLAVRPLDLRREIMESKPDIVHICGHGEGELGLCIEDDLGNLQLVSTEALSDLFRLASNTVDCVLINTCYSQVQAEAISKHIQYVIGMNQAIKDKAAIQFAIGFYDGIGAGESIERSFEIGQLAILLELEPALTPERKAIYDELEKTVKQRNLSEHLIPVLYKSENLPIQGEYIDPEDYTGTVWTHIIPEIDNVEQRHIVRIDWGNYYWEEAMKIPQEGILLIYEKRNEDDYPRLVTISPANQSYQDGVVKITSATKIYNGHLELPDVKNRKNINQGWQQLNEQMVSQMTINNLQQLKQALKNTKFCGQVKLSEQDFKEATLVAQLNDGYYVYHLNHNVWGVSDKTGGQHVYVTSISKSENFEQSYQSIILAYYGAFFGRAEIFDILKRLRGE